MLTLLCWIQNQAAIDTAAAFFFYTDQNGGNGGQGQGEPVTAVRCEPGTAHVASHPHPPGARNATGEVSGYRLPCFPGL